MTSTQSQTMTYVVAFDDSVLARGALRKAVEYAEPTDSEVIAVTIIPEYDVPYLRDKGWIGRTRGTRTVRMQEATAGAVSAMLRNQIARIEPDVEFVPVVIDRQVDTTETIGAELRTVISDHGGTDVFVGAREPTHIVSALIDARDPKFHLHLIRRPYIPDLGLEKYS